MSNVLQVWAFISGQWVFQARGNEGDEEQRDAELVLFGEDKSPYAYSNEWVLFTRQPGWSGKVNIDRACFSINTPLDRIQYEAEAIMYWDPVVDRVACMVEEYDCEPDKRPDLETFVEQLKEALTRVGLCEVL